MQGRGKPEDNMLKTKLSLSRREFGVMMGATGLAYGVGRNFVSSAFAQGAVNAAEVIKGKSPELIVINAKLGVMETPLTLLRKYQHTPKDLLFCRFHYPHEGDQAWFATTALPPEELIKNWTLDVGGLVERSRKVKIADLQKMPQEKRVSVLQCAGNGRSYYAAKQKAVGGQWKNGGMANLEWEGVPLRHFLDEMKLMPADSARWLTAQGWDQPVTPVGSGFSKSYHMSDAALDHAIIALKMNGEPIPAAHGGPVRLIIPGFYGNMCMKMLTGLNLMPDQSVSFYQRVGYRMPNELPADPQTFKADDYTIFNSRPTYGQVIKSVIFSPLPEDKPKAGNVEITGVAFNDGTAAITSVEVSSDGGKTWTRAEIKPPESPWAWHHWTAKGALKRGSNILMCRATDALGRTQPIEGVTRWQPRGYEWNGVERLQIDI
jgi:sulfite oxidase